jgi:hypothetical protein
LTNPVIDGLLGYYKRLGLLQDVNDVIQVEPKIGRFENSVHGHPFTNVVANLDGQVRPIAERGLPILISTFSDQYQREYARSLGLQTIGEHSSVEANSKSRLREYQKKYNYQMLPGAVIDNTSDLSRIVDEFKQFESGVFLKFPTGSGGDLGIHLEIRSLKDLEEGIRKIRDRINQALNNGKFGIGIDDFWPPDMPCPPGLPLVIEAHYRNVGELIMNGSTQFITRSDGTWESYGIFKQYTNDKGEYLGNEPIVQADLDTAQKGLIEAEVEKVARYNIDENRYFGLQGVDWFLIKRQDGTIACYIVELNARPTANTPPLIIAQKLGATFWLNINCFPANRDFPIHTIDDYIHIVGKDLADGENGQLVIPQAFRTFRTTDRLIPSPDFKAMIIGRDRQDIAQIVLELHRRGIKV